MDIDPAIDRDMDGAMEADGTQMTDIFSGLFCEVQAPLLQAPSHGSLPSHLSKTHVTKKKRELAATHTSLYQATRPYNIPVSEHATHKVMHKLEFFGSEQQQAPDDALAGYVDR